MAASHFTFDQEMFHLNCHTHYFHSLRVESNTDWLNLQSISSVYINVGLVGQIYQPLCGYKTKYLRMHKIQNMYAEAS